MKAYLLAALLGAALCWGILASRQSAKVREYERLIALAAEQTRVADSTWAAGEAGRIADSLRIDSLTQPNPALPRLIQERNAARLAARVALDSARTASDSLKAVSDALKGSEGREDALLDSLRQRDKTMAEVRAEGLARMATDRARIGELTTERDRWKVKAESAPTSQILEKWILGLPRPRCVVGPGLTVGGRVAAGASLTCGMPIG